MGDDLPDYELGINVLKQALASLTAVVSASALDIRALNSEDLPHIGLPYNSIKFESVFDDTNNNAADWLEFDNTDWGAGLDFYPQKFLFYMLTTETAFMKQKLQGFTLRLFEKEGETNIPIFAKTYNRNNVGLYEIDVLGTPYWGLEITEDISGVLINNGNTFNVYFQNQTGVNLETDNLALRIVGIAI